MTKEVQDYFVPWIRGFRCTFPRISNWHGGTPLDRMMSKENPDPAFRTKVQRRPFRNTGRMAETRLIPRDPRGALGFRSPVPEKFWAGKFQKNLNPRGSPREKRLDWDFGRKRGSPRRKGFSGNKINPFSGQGFSFRKGSGGEWERFPFPKAINGPLGFRGNFLPKILGGCGN